MEACGGGRSSDFLKDRHPYRDPPFAKEIDKREIAVAFGSRALPKLLALLANRELDGAELFQVPLRCSMHDPAHRTGTGSVWRETEHRRSDWRELCASVCVCLGAGRR